MNEALTRILLVSDGAVMALKERTSGAYADTRTPTSDLAATIDGLADRYRGCKTHRTRLAVIKEAQETAVRLCYAPDRSKIRGTLEWKQAIGADPRSCRVVAAVFHASLRDVVAYRKAHRVTKV